MAIIKYYGEEIDAIEKKKNVSFFGYINPMGKLIDYTTLIGEQTHCTTKNPASMLFLDFVSYVLKGYNLERYKNGEDWQQAIYARNIVPELGGVLLRGYRHTFPYLNRFSYEEFLNELDCRYNYWAEKMALYDDLDDVPVYDMLQWDLIRFFKEAYESGDFFQSIGTVIQLECFDDYIKEHAREIEAKKDSYMCDSRYFYNEYQKACLMPYLKEILVSYLGYDAINKKLRTIVTSCDNPLRFYNYFKREWVIDYVSRRSLNVDAKKIPQVQKKK